MYDFTTNKGTFANFHIGTPNTCTTLVVPCGARSCEPVDSFRVRTEVTTEFHKLPEARRGAITSDEHVIDESEIALDKLQEGIGRVGENTWSLQVSKDVTGEIGKAVSLPCLFSHPHKSHDSGLTVIWRIKHPYNGTVVFKCVSESSSDPCKTTINYMSKFHLIGNLRNNNISISIENLTWEDSNRYYCRVELSRDRHDKYETKSGTWLHLSAPPRIVNLSVAFDNARGYHAFCTAEGEPVPSLIWTDPLNNHEYPILPSPILKHQRTSELHHLRYDGKYTCVATNSHGKVEGAVYFFKFTAGGSSKMGYIILCAALGAKILLLFLMFAVVTYYSRADNTKSFTDLSRNTQESTYENYNQGSG
ncbi:sialic acid-binding Ig-like lectin 15 [Hyla sarda]|uniref:sialic acid-binding Ig-like lectin 15 n=1 Tax=Hyla sarda TaxID=327740 RepID=UPI0024C4349E|nr:sialic acid-binding Ig-like lectin 15 [Hyla sarda]